MLWNPFQFQWTATYLKDEGAHAVLEIRKGAFSEFIHFPKSLLPSHLQPNDAFVLKLEDSASNKQNETATLQALLKELIR